eukprot:m.29043 g.29043  ORF g.29043 m.29043 type:complete len:266 (+) comp12077_c0_seq1:45-842(+)
MDSDRDGPERASSPTTVVSTERPTSTDKRSVHDRLGSRKRPGDAASGRNDHQEQKRRGIAESGAAERTGSARHPASDQKSPTKEPPVRSQRPQRRSTDKVVRRNKRMFGMLNATLKTASVKTGTQEKAEAKQEAVARRLVKEQADSEKQRREEKVAKLEAAASLILQDSEEVVLKERPKWAAHNQILSKHYILTKATPRLFYLPAKHNSRTRDGLEDSRSDVLTFLTQRQDVALANGDEAMATRRLSRTDHERRKRSLGSVEPVS